MAQRHKTFLDFIVADNETCFFGMSHSLNARAPNGSCATNRYERNYAYILEVANQDSAHLFMWLKALFIASLFIKVKLLLIDWFILFDCSCMFVTRNCTHENRIQKTWQVFSAIWCRTSSQDRRRQDIFDPKTSVCLLPSMLSFRYGIVRIFSVFLNWKYRWKEPDKRKLTEWNSPSQGHSRWFRD